jgi:hypothetical protein
MDISLVLPGVGLMFDGTIHEDSPQLDEMLSAAEEWLVTELGWSRRRAQFATVWHPGLTANDAWVAGHPDHGIHFVQAHHDGARPVTVVHVPVPPDEDAERAEMAAALRAAGRHADAALYDPQRALGRFPEQ